MLFDLDGTLIDTGELHYQATLEALSMFDRSIDRAEYDVHIHGNNNASIVSFLFPESEIGLDHPYVDTKESLFRRSLTKLPPIAGANEIIAWAKARGMPIGLVTNAPRDNKDAMLAAISMTDLFDTVVLGDELPRGKPDPLPFQVALRNLGVAADRAIGFEDSAHGVTALVAAGVHTVGITTGLRSAVLISHGAAMTIADYHDQALQDMLARRDPLNNSDR